MSALKFLSKYVRPAWDTVAGGVQSLKYLDKKDESVKALEEAKKTINSCGDVHSWYKKRNLRYLPESSDVESRPWVTVARNGGDCEDFMALSEELLWGKLKTKRGVCRSKEGNSHAILAVKEGETWTLMSNNFVPVYGLKDLEQVGKYTYKEKTATWYFY